MPPRDWRLRVGDILESIDRIRAYTTGMTFEQFANDTKTIDAVLRNITIIGEAARHVLAEISERHPEIPWQDMRDMRNVVVHEYFGVNKRILWDTVRKNLSPLDPLLRKLLGSSAGETT